MCTAEYVRGVHSRIRDNLVSLLGEQQGTFPAEVQELLQEDGTVRRSVLSEIRKACAIAQADLGCRVLRPAYRSTSCWSGGLRSIKAI